MINNDIALVQLDRPVILNSRVGTVCLPKQDIQVPVGSRCVTTGETLFNQNVLFLFPPKHGKIRLLRNHQNLMMLSSLLAENAMFVKYCLARFLFHLKILCSDADSVEILETTGKAMGIPFSP